ncbi:MAG: class I SAM-dependent methyltransferase [Candidatus Binatia bacterium]
MQAAYDDIAWCYDSYWAGSFDAMAWGVLRRLLIPELPTGAAVLDIGCGCGHLTRRLVECGYRVVGVEPSLEMIERMRQRAPGTPVIAGDARALPVRARFDAALFTFDGLNHLLEPGDLDRAFGGAASVLRCGAPFFFDLLIEDAYRHAWHGERAIVADNHVVIVRGAYDASAGEGRTEFIVFTRDGGGWNRRDTHIRQRPYAPEAVAGAAERAGFVSLQWWHAQRDLDLDDPLATGRVFGLART